MQQKYYGILGFPLGHSLSPILHNTAFRNHNWPGRYEKFSIAPSELASFMEEVRHRPIHGLSVTIPYKQQIIPYLDDLTPLAGQTGAVNTVYWQNNKLLGDNTDIEGFLSPLLSLPSFPASALVLGTGGAAHAVVNGLVRQNCLVTVCGRDPQKSQALAQKFHSQFVPWEEKEQARANMLINTTPLGMSGKFSGMSPWDKSLKNFSLVYDLIYVPAQTPLLALAKKAGCQTLNGQAMFAAQAARQFFLWTGQKMNEKRALEAIKMNEQE